MVLHADEYALQQQKQNQNQLETKLAKEYGLSVDEYRAQKDLLDEANKTVNSDHDKRIGRDKNLDRIPSDPPLADQNEECLTAATRVPVGGDYRQMDESVYLVKTGQPVDPERVELERQALEGYNKQREHHDHRHEDIHNYQVIEEGHLKEKEVEGFIEIYQFTSSQHSGNGASADRRQVLQRPSTNHDYQNLPNITPNTTLNFPGGAKRSSHTPILSDRSPHSSLPAQTILSSDPPAQDPSQFAIGSMVSVPTQRGDPLLGVVMWIGTLPEIDGVIAGVELVSYIALIH